ncbi:MAG: vanadium-dependent haloperoxidase [Bacteroidota bacterium]
MSNFSKIYSIFLIGFFLFGCESDERYIDRLNETSLFNDTMQQLTDVIVYDIFSPPVASRVYVYPTIAAYSIMQKAYPEKYKSLEGQLNDYSSISDINDPNIIPNLSAIHAFLFVGKSLIFSENKIDEYRENLYKDLQKLGLPKRKLNQSIAYGEIVANEILKWADNDFYKQTRTYPKYTIQREDRYWKPTPPDYMEGIEPHWNKIRPMIIPYANIFNPPPPLKIDMNYGSPFYDELLEVYRVGRQINENNDDSEESKIAAFWDCNPYVSHHKGHAMFATKKITPGGHWIGITKIATELSNDSFDEAINSYLQVSIALFDGFISNWDTKWNTLVVRPETLINQYIDEEWLPKLQTPPFPEYTSGHSVISKASAVVLTKIYGDDFSFDDTTEVKYGLPIRSFSSFMHAADEAAISRLYGGIHYRMAIEHGVIQGERVGSYISTYLNSRKDNQDIAQN